MARRTGGPRRPPGDYEVGYGKPPVVTRFQKGRSGNPKGRPREARNAGTIVADILARKITLRDGRGERQVSYLEALLIRAAEKAGKGDLRTLRFLIDLHEQSQAGLPEAGEARDLEPDDQSLIADYIARVQGESGEDEP